MRFSLMRHDGVPSTLDSFRGRVVAPNEARRCAGPTRPNPRSKEFWDHPGDWYVLVTELDDGVMTGSAERVHYPDWYKEYRAAEGLTWGRHVLHGHRGINQPDECWDGQPGRGYRFRRFLS